MMVSKQPGLVVSEGKYFKIFQPRNIWLKPLTELDLLNPKGLKSNALHITTAHRKVHFFQPAFPIHKPQDIDVASMELIQSF